MKIENRTIPVRKGVKGAIRGIALGATAGLAGPSVLNNVVVTLTTAAGGYIGDKIDGERGAAIGSIINFYDWWDWWSCWNR